MAKQLSDLISGVRTYLDEPTPVDFSAAEVLAAINFRYHYVVSKVVEVYQEFYLTTTPLQYDTIADQQQYTISSTLLKIERVEINYDTSNPNNNATRAAAIKMDEVPTNLNNSILNGSATVFSGYYIAGAQAVQQIGFVPVPPNDGTNAISIWGIQAPSDLVSTTDPVLIPYPDLFAQIIIKLASGDLLKKGQQAVPPADDLIAEGTADILNMQTFIVERQSDGPNMIEDAAYDDINLANYIY